MKLIELLETKAKKKPAETPRPRDFVAKAVTRKTGAGSHTSKKFTRKEKHKKSQDDNS